MNFVEGGDDSPAPPSHRLHRLELEISTGDEPLARSVMDRLSQLHHAALESLLERVFSELSPPDRWDRLERLELDLGTLQASDLEQQLPQRLEAALRRALAARLPPPLPPETSTATAGPAADADGLQRQLELLALFTATGSLPWWAPRHDRHLIAAALDTALALPPPELRALLQQLAGPPGEPSVALQRLLAAASPQQRPRIEQALQEEPFAAKNPEAPLESPTKADTTPTTSVSTPTTTAPPEAPGEPDPNPPNPSALAHLAIYASTGRWPPGEGLGPNPPQALEAALDSALALPPPELRALLQQLASPPGEPSAALQRLLAAASPQQRPRLEAALQATPEEAPEAELQAQLVAAKNRDAPVEPPTNADASPTITAPPEAPGEPDPNPPNPSALASLALYASTGRWPPGEGLGPNPPQALEAALDTARAVTVQGEAAMKAAPVETLDAALQEALKPTEAAAGDSTATARPTISEPPPPPPALQLPKATPPAAPQPRSDLDDELVIDGAGMVLLWPFLETLFSRLELLTQERLFGDEAQRQRAMALLGFLVDGDGDPPEWRLTLAKLLCGALPQAPYGLEAPLSDAEQAEAEALLQAVLGHADGRLGDDGAALRQDFLQRPGLLSARPGAWVLQVERRSGDEVLDGLPWSWSWIRLPWMDDLLQVVW